MGGTTASIFKGKKIGAKNGRRIAASKIFKNT